MDVEKIDIEFLGKHNIELPDNLQREIEGMSFSETAVYFKERFSLKESLEEIKKIWNNMAIDKYKNEVKLKKVLCLYLNYSGIKAIKQA